MKKNLAMKLFQRSVIVFAVFVLAACQVQPTPLATATSNPQADEAQQIIFQTERYVLGVTRSDGSYYRAVEYAARDALERFPDDPRAESWKWKLAYYAILAGDTQLGNDTYIDLIDTALNNGQVDVESLPSWFHPGELTEANRMIPFELSIEKIITRGDEKKYLIGINSFPGGSCFLLVQSSDEYSTSLIFNGFPVFPLGSYDSLKCTPKDVTNDGNDEVILENYIGAHIGISYLRVMDVSVTPIQLLPFLSQNNEVAFIQYDEIVKDFPISDGKTQLRTADYAYPCQATLETTYEWNGNNFVPLNMEFLADIEYAPLKDCLYYSLAFARWVDIDFGVKIIDQALLQYETIAANKQEKEMLDELNLEKALLYLFADRPSDALVVMQEVAQNPYQVNGIWVEPAKKFLEIYHDSADIYRACSELVAFPQSDSGEPYYRNLCDQSALLYLAREQLKNVPLSDLASTLQVTGVNILSMDWFDLDDDGRDELWLIVIPPHKPENKPNEFWIASDYPSNLHLFYVPPVAGVPNDSSRFQIERISAEEVFVRPPEFLSFIWSRDKNTNEPNFQMTHCVVAACYLLEQERRVDFEELRRQLQRGEDPYELYVEYMNLKKRYEVNSSLDKCADCYFDLGYIAELVGDKKIETEMYLKLIELFPNHPLSILAESKLERLK